MSNIQKPPNAITASLWIDNGGEAPAYCLMVAYRSEADAVYALALLNKPPKALKEFDDIKEGKTK